MMTDRVELIAAPPLVPGPLERPRSPAQGVVLGVALSLPVWALVGVSIWRLVN
jgi:hypothetical protein